MKIKKHQFKAMEAIMRKKLTLLTISLFATTLFGCVSTGYEKGINSYSSDEKKTLAVDIKTNNQGLKIGYSNHLNTDIPFNERFSEIISTGNYSGEITVPKGQELFISAYEYDKVKFYTEGSTKVNPGDSSAKVEIDILEVYPKLVEITSTLDEDQKIELIKVLGLYDEAINAPKKLMDTLHSKAKSKLEILYRKSELKYTELDMYLSKVDSNISIATLPKIGVTGNYDNEISQARRMINIVRHSIL